MMININTMNFDVMTMKKNIMGKYEPKKWNAV